MSEESLACKGSKLEPQRKLPIKIKRRRAKGRTYFADKKWFNGALVRSEGSCYNISVRR
jgi:hypothetical protein